MPAWTTLILVRHGHTAANEQGLHVVMSGVTNVPLGADGVREARILAEALANEPPFSCVYTSPLERARSTARTIAERCSLELRVADGLGEIDCGEADGLRLFEVQARYPDHWRRNLEQTDPSFRWPGGESYAEFRERAIRGTRRIAEAHLGERVVVVTHAGVISQLLGFVHGSSPARWEEFRPQTGSISEIAWAAERVVVRRFDQSPATALAPSELAAPD